MIWQDFFVQSDGLSREKIVWRKGTNLLLREIFNDAKLRILV